MKRTILILLIVTLVFGLFLHGNQTLKTVTAAVDNFDLTEVNCSDAVTMSNSANSAVSERNKSVYLGGVALGLTIDGDGVTVIGLNEFVDSSGALICPAVDAGIEINDVIVELDGRKVFNSSKLAEIATQSGGRALSLKYIRNGNCEYTTITPKTDFATGNYRLGLWTRDSSSGLGTLTFVKKDLTFGCLGHPICDAAGSLVQCDNGGVFGCTLNGIEKGKRGSAGELRGQIEFENRLGSLLVNNKYGAYGVFDSLPSFCGRIIEVAEPSEIKPGKATIFCQLPQCERTEYEIEIVKASFQRSCEEKGLVVHITDKRLLESTGGIVQGMSGSPIVQNGKLVGAVTHVFINDPTRGYGIYAKWMVNN